MSKKQVKKTRKRLVQLAEISGLSVDMVARILARTDSADAAGRLLRERVEPKLLASDLRGVNPAREEEAVTAARLARTEGISELDAHQLLEMRYELAQLEAGESPMLLSQAVGDRTGVPAPWLDSRPLSKPPQPWNEDHWARDQRRAAAAGLDVDKAAWSAHAELGRDVVGELAQQNRESAIAMRRANLDGFLENAQSRERQRAVAANEKRLDQEAAKLIEARQQRTRRDHADPAVMREDLQHLDDRAADHRLT